VDGTGSVGAQNNCGDVVAFCQTVLPGNEAMLIPTSVESWSQLAVPGISYWASTAAQYVLLSSLLPNRTNTFLAITLTLQELELKRPASGVMDPSHSETGLHMSLEPTLMQMETLLRKLGGTQSGLAADLVVPPQHSESRSSVVARAAMGYLVLLTRPWMVLAASPALIKLLVRVVLISASSRFPKA
jgi:hypothetical protein